MKQTKQLLLIPLLVFLASCATVAPGNNDPVLVNAQRTATTAHQAFDLLFQLERDNEAYVKQYAPAVHTGVNAIRRQAPKAEKDLWASIETYRVNRTAANKADLSTYLAVMQTLLERAEGYTKQIQSKGP